MKLIECYIDNFGKLSDYSHTFTDGLNVIYRENGFGKTTLTVFIKSMLFGLEDTKKAKLEENDRKHYFPWQKGRCGGSLTFSHGGKTYRIERTFMPKASDDKFALFDLESGKESKDFSKNLGEELFGIDADGFERSVFLSERKLSVKNENKKISAKISDLVGVDCDLGELDDAIDALEERRKYYYKKGGSGKISETQNEISALEAEIASLERLSESVPALNEKLTTKKAEIERKKQEAALLEKTENALERGKLYLAKKKAREDVQNELLDSNVFFSSKLPTQKEIREAEALQFEYANLKKQIGCGNISPALKEKKKAELLSCNEIIKKYNSIKKPDVIDKKAYPVLIILAGISIIVGILLGIFVSPPLLLEAVISVAFIALGIKNKADIKKSSQEYLAYEKQISEIEAFIKPYKEICREELIGGRLYEIKSSLEKELSEIDEQEKLLQNSDALLAEIKSFTSLFPTKTSDPFIEIREALIARERILERLKYADAELDDLARGIDASVFEIFQDGAFKSNLPAINERIIELEKEYGLLEREFKQVKEEILALDELYERKRELSDLLDYRNERLKIINLAKEHLAGAKDSITAKYLGKTKAAFSEYAEQIIKEDPNKFTMDTSFSLLRDENGESKPSEAYSLGTRELFAIAMRFSLIDSLYDKEEPFIILDDPFVHFDDEKAERCLKLIEKLSNKKQILYFTCSKSRTV